MIGNVALPQGDREESGRGLQRQAKIFFFFAFCFRVWNGAQLPGMEARGEGSVRWKSVCVCAKGGIDRQRDTAQSPIARQIRYRLSTLTSHYLHTQISMIRCMATKAVENISIFKQSFNYL